MMEEERTRRLLLVEDDGIVALAERSVLERHGFDVVVAHNGERAVEAIDDDQSIDLVLMDVDLGEGISGVEAARSILCGRSLPVVFLTSHAERDVVDTVKQITRYGYVLKSSGEFVLLEAIDTAFELYETHRRLEKSEQKYRTMVETAPMPFQSLDEDGNLIDVNGAWLDTLGYGRDDVIGTWFGDLLHPDEACLFRERFPVFKTRGHVEAVEFRLRRSDGEHLRVRYNGCIAYTEDGRFSHTVCIFQVVTNEQGSSNAARHACSRGARLIEHQIDSAVLGDEEQHEHAPGGVDRPAPEEQSVACVLLRRPDVEVDEREQYAVHERRCDRTDQPGQMLLLVGRCRPRAGVCHA